MLAEATEESGRRPFFGHGQTRHDLAQPNYVRGKHRIEQGSPFGRQLAKDDTLVFGGCASTNQPSLFKLLDRVGGTRPRHEDPITNHAGSERLRDVSTEVDRSRCREITSVVAPA